MQNKQTQTSSSPLIGVGYRPFYADEFRNAYPEGIEWIELLAENYFSWNKDLDSESLKQADRLRKLGPLALHGVSLSLGSADGVSHEGLRKMKKLIDRLDPMIVSDHLCWTGVEGKNLHDLYPLPHTQEAVRVVSENILRVQDTLKRKILIENVSSYLRFPGDEMEEWDFINEVLKRTDCGLLLDVNNVYVNSVNHSFDPEIFFRAIPWDRVGQIHLAGHRDKGTHLIDTHDEPVRDEVFTLLERAKSHASGRRIPAMIERDARFPEWSELRAEIERMEQIWSPKTGLKKGENDATPRTAEKVSA